MIPKTCLLPALHRYSPSYFSFSFPYHHILHLPPSSHKQLQHYFNDGNLWLWVSNKKKEETIQLKLLWTEETFAQTMPIELVFGIQHSSVILSILSVNTFSDSYHLRNCFNKANLALQFSLTRKVFKISFVPSFSLTLSTEQHFIWGKKNQLRQSPKVIDWHLLSQTVAFMWNHTEFLELALSVVCKIPVSWNRVLRTHVRV